MFSQASGHSQRQYGSIPLFAGFIFFIFIYPSIVSSRFIPFWVTWGHRTQPSTHTFTPIVNHYKYLNALLEYRFLKMRRYEPKGQSKMVFSSFFCIQIQHYLSTVVSGDKVLWHPQVIWKTTKWKCKYWEQTNSLWPS